MVPSRIRNALVLAGQATEVQAPIVAANVKRSCPGSWCSNGEAIAIASGGGSIKLPPRAGRLMMGSSLNGAMIPAHVTSALDRPFVVLFELSAPTKRVMASSLVKMPTTSVRRLISPLRRSANPDPKKGLYSHRGPKGICWTVLQDPGCV
jgi:hypothetical protein